MKSTTFLKTGSCLLLCLTGLLFSSSFSLIANTYVCSGIGLGDPVPFPPNPPPPPPPSE